MIGKIINIAGKKYKVVARTSGNEYTLEEVLENKNDKFAEIIADIEALSNRMDKLTASVNKIYKLIKDLHDVKFDNHIEG